MAPTHENIQTRNALVLGNLGFVHSHVKEKWSGLKNSGHYDDIVSEGIMGLFRAAEKFDPSRGNTFLTYAVHWIDQRIRKYISKASLPVTIPPNRIAIQKTAEKNYRRYGHKENLILSDLLSEPDLQSPEMSLSAIFSKASPTNIFFSYQDESKSPLEFLLANEDKAQLMSAIQSLGDRSEKIVSEYYGISGDSKTLEDVGRMIHVTRERIRQVLNIARGRLLLNLKTHFSEKFPQFDSFPFHEHGTSWSSDRLKDNAHPYFDKPIHGWVSDCPSCGDAVWNSRHAVISCANCGYDSDATRTCFKCGEGVLVGFPCYCDYLPSREEATLKWNIRRVLLFVSPCSLESMAEELKDLGISLDRSEIRIRLQRDITVICDMDGNYYLRESAPHAILELDRISKRLDEIELAFLSKSELLEHQLRGNRKDSVRVSLVRKELLALEQDYLVEKERLITKWETLAVEMRLGNQRQRESAGVEK